MSRLILILVIALLAYAAYRYMSSSKSLSNPQSDARRDALPARGPADFEEAAGILEGPERGYGILRLSPSQLLFAANSGRLTAIERLDITGVTATTELPTHTTAKPVLVVTVGTEVYYFAVEDAAAWERRLL